MAEKRDPFAKIINERRVGFSDGFNLPAQIPQKKPKRANRLRYAKSVPNLQGYKFETTKGEELQRSNDRARNQPVALASLDRDDAACKLFFQGFYDHYIECLLAGRLDAWRKAINASVDLLCCPTIKVEKRSSKAVR